MTHMYNKLIFFLVFITSLAMPAKSQPFQQVMSKEVVIKLIPKSDDLLDLQERKNLLELIASVDSIYPILCDELLLTNHPNTPATIISILGESKKNRGKIAKCIVGYMDLHKYEFPQPKGISSGIGVLGSIGGAEEIDFLAHFINIGFDVNRVVAAQSIEQIRTREQARERDAERLNRNSEKGEIENSENLDSKFSRLLVSELTGADKPQMNSVRFWPWALGALVLIAAIVILKCRKNISS